MSKLHYPSLDDEELLRVAQDSTDPLVEDLVKRLSKALDRISELAFAEGELTSKVSSLEQYIERNRAMKG